MKTEELTVREYDKERDELLAVQWCKAHCRAAFIPALLSPLGLVCEWKGNPVCMCWAEMVVGVGKARLEQPISAPGLNLTESRLAFGYLILALKKALAALDYGVLICETLPGIARYLQRCHGFQVADTNAKQSMICFLPREAA